MDRTREYGKGQSNNPTFALNPHCRVNIAAASSTLTAIQGMCKNIVEKGNLSQPLLIFNRTEQRSIDLSAKLQSGKTIVAPSIKEAVEKSDVSIYNCMTGLFMFTYCSADNLYMPRRRQSCPRNYRQGAGE
jgi:hypothetical protein